MSRWRQKLHTEPPDGWLNDPNGLCCLNGIYHVYFQYSPGSPEGKSLRCWGHYSGKSLASLAYDDVVLYPDIPEDRSGVYSGSAVVIDGKIHLYYTGNVKEEGEHDYIRSGRGANVIHVVSDDGHNMQKKQVLLRNCDYPDFCSCHVRDPKVWQADGQLNMVLGARTLDDRGCVLLYRADTPEDWKYVTAVSVPDFGYMWECPDYFTLNKQGFLSVSPQGLPHQETKFQNVYQSGYFPVTGRLEDNRLGNFAEWDMGFDFYAPQTFETPDGRRIVIAWMGIGDIDYINPTVSLGWQHCLTLPREVTPGKSGKLLQNPVSEILELFDDEIQLTSGESAEIQLPALFFGRTQGSYSMAFDNRLNLGYDSDKKLFTLEFTDNAYGGGRTVRKAEIESCHDIRIIADMSSLEIYLGGGETVFSTRFYPDGERLKISLNGGISGAYSNLKEKCYGR